MNGTNGAPLIGEGHLTQGLEIPRSLLVGRLLPNYQVGGRLLIGWRAGISAQ